MQTMLMALLERHVGSRGRSDLMSENWKYSLVSWPALVSLLAYVACHFGEGSIIMVVDRDAVVFEEVVQHALSCTFLRYDCMVARLPWMVVDTRLRFSLLAWEVDIEPSPELHDFEVACG